MKKFRFIDLFSGIGGFHQAMEQLGGECILASEIDKSAINVYKNNYGIDSAINVRDINTEELPDFSVLCAGFPCQTFSKAGSQLGLKDKTRGTLFFEIVRILNDKHPKYFILENVRNLVSHDNGNTWEIIQENIKEQGYRTTEQPLILSPHYFGIPQTRERVIILGKYDPENVDKPLVIEFEKFKDKKENSIYSILDKNVDESYHINEYEEKVLTAWDEFYQGINCKVIGFPIWADFFKYSGSYDNLPKWKVDFINKNKKLYTDNKKFIDKWLKKYNNLEDFAPTHHKFEWQCGTSISSIWEGVIQFRPSGIRVKKPDCFQALVAMVQIPIIGKYRRRMTVEEAARLQSFPVDRKKSPFISDENKQQAYKQYGNSVNVEVIRKAAEELFKN